MSVNRLQSASSGCPPEIRFPLHAAAAAGDEGRVRQLLGLREGRPGLAIRVDGVDNVGRTALHVAAQFGRRSVCEVHLGLHAS
jgi:ankyrin repeat protein